MATRNVYKIFLEAEVGKRAHRAVCIFNDETANPQFSKTLNYNAPHIPPNERYFLCDNEYHYLNDIQELARNIRNDLDEIIQFKFGIISIPGESQYFFRDKDKNFELHALNKMEEAVFKREFYEL